MHAPTIALQAAPAASGRELIVSAEDGIELAATLFEPGIAAAGETSSSS
jgi:hypothetical protein